MIRAIETAYNGYLFRSRLEARWAVFLDALGIRYEYEPQGFVLPSGRYLPDFRLRGWDDARGAPSNLWVEIKGEEPTDRERRLAQELADEGAATVYLFAGSIAIPPREGPNQALGFFPGGSAFGFRWVACPRCGRRGIIRTRVPYCPHCPESVPSPAAEQLIEAYLAARTARFEFGYTGRPPV